MAGPGRHLLPAAGPAFVGLAEVAYHRNDLDAALQNVGEGVPLCRRFVHTPPLVAGLITLAWVRRASADPAGAEDAMREAERLSPGPFGLLNPVPAQAARLRLAQGNVAAAAEWVAINGLCADEHLRYPRELGHLVLARVLLAEARPDDALAVLDRLYASAISQCRTGSVIEILALRALALATADGEGALDALGGALELAGRHGHVRIFTDEGAPMAALLGRLSAAPRTGRSTAAIPDEFLLRVQRSFAGPPKPDVSRPTTGRSPLLDPLTARESEILDLIADGKSNQAIAAELVISVDTVKKHVTHILDKLGATNRTEAVARGRELGLID